MATGIRANIQSAKGRFEDPLLALMRVGNEQDVESFGYLHDVMQT